MQQLLFEHGTGCGEECFSPISLSVSVERWRKMEYPLHLHTRRAMQMHTEHAKAILSVGCDLKTEGSKSNTTNGRLIGVIRLAN